jgi:predicted metalloprotease with PDZ domain
MADAAQGALTPITYVLRFPAPATHYVDIEAEVPTSSQPQVELRMAVWTPGSYLVREYSRNVEAVAARLPDGSVAPVTKIEKNKWRIDTRGAATVRLSYRVYAREMGVRSNYIDPDFALLNGAATFISLAESAPRPHDVRIELPSGWTDVKTALTAVPGSPRTFRAADFDTLVDSPLVLGSPAVYPFTVDGVRHELVNVGDAGVWDGPKSARDIEQIVRAETAFWATIPYPSYLFLNVISEGSGAIEHKNSTVLMTSRWRTATRKPYLDWLSTAAHEFFHAWNVKRLRPVELGPFDYDRENYTRSLWIAEGLTEYYGDLFVRRAGISSDPEYLDALSDGIERLQTTPGRLVQSVEQASFDAWIKHYRPDDNSNNVAVDYYVKGAVVGFLLDAEIRRATGNRRSLDDVMRTAYARFSGPSGFTTAQWKGVASEVAGRDLSAWFTRATESTEELDYEPALQWYGLRFKPAQPPGDKGWLGAVTRNDGGRLIVTHVPRGTPAEAAGVSVDDEIVAIDDFRVRAEQWDQRLGVYHPGTTVTLLVARRDKLVKLNVTFGSEPERAWRLEVDPAAAADQRAHLQAWLTGAH